MVRPADSEHVHSEGGQGGLRGSTNVEGNVSGCGGVNQTVNCVSDDVSCFSILVIR